MATLPKVIYRFNAIPIENPGGFFFFFFAGIDKLILKLIWKCKGLKIAKTILKNKNKTGGLKFPILKLST